MIGRLVAGGAVTVTLSAALFSCTSHAPTPGPTIRVETGDGVRTVAVRDLNVIGECSRVLCPVQWDPSHDPDNMSGWTGTVSQPELARDLGFRLYFGSDS